jgi:predicted dehydrogenase
MAMEMGKHVFVQKPLTHTLWEARELTRLARKHKVATIMGNQGRAGEGIRLMREWVQAGAIGPVHEVHIWTNRPIWPQGLERPTEVQPVPDTLDWNLWLGTAPVRPYNKAYLPKWWRGWWDFGCGALGDMGCHIMDASFYALDLGSPVSVEAVSSGVNSESAPLWSIITYQFPARNGMPPVTVKWYDGGKLPPRPKDLEADRKLPRGGQILLGEKGTIMDATDYCWSPRIIPEEKMREFLPHRPPATIARVPKGNHYQEWIRACKGGPAAGSNFDYAGPLSEMVLLGNLALRVGKKIEWDGPNLRVSNVPEANLLVRNELRKY